jgi:lysophospholipase L1-like esterase
LKKSAFFSAAIFVVSIVLGLLAIEGILRLQNSSMQNYNIEMWRYARELKKPSEVPELGHEHLKDRSAILQSVEIRLNGWGLRGGPVPPLPPGGRRILVLGGSITLGWGVPEDQTMTARLEQMFKAKGENVEVLNAGVGNYNALRYTEHFFRDLEGLQPTDIVVHYFLRDAETLEPGGGNILLRHSQLAVTVWAAIQNLTAPSGEKVLTDHYRSVYAEDQPGYAAMKEELAKLAAYAEEHGIRIYLAMIPDVHNLKDYPFRDIHEQMRRVAGELGYRYVDLLPGFGSLDPAEIWAMPGDPHPNALGHQIMAEQLFPVLDQDR